MRSAQNGCNLLAFLDGCVHGGTCEGVVLMIPLEPYLRSLHWLAYQWDCLRLNLFLRLLMCVNCFEVHGRLIHGGLPRDVRVEVIRGLKTEVRTYNLALLWNLRGRLNANLANTQECFFVPAIGKRAIFHIVIWEHLACRDNNWGDGISFFPRQGESLLFEAIRLS